MTDADLRLTERQVFRATADDGLWDFMIAGFATMFAIAPLLSERLGDFWSSAVFIPVFAFIYIASRAIRGRIVVDRIGVVEYGALRKRRLRRFHIVLALVNGIALALGIISWVAFERGVVESWLFPAMLSVIVLAACSTAAYFLDVPRFFLYGILLALAPLVGEWLFRRDLATHHGYPITFAVAAGVMAIGGLLRFHRVTSGRSATVGYPPVENDV